MTEGSTSTKTWFGQPSGLSTLFFTELWERFSYYGMRALLVLFMVDVVQNGGMGLDDKTATSIYGLYTAFVYLAALPGGWIADRLLGAQRSVWIGGLVIAWTLSQPGLTHALVGARDGAQALENASASVELAAEDVAEITASAGLLG